jgi:hypothetical protein
MPPLSPRKKLAYTLVLLAILWGLTELACWVGLRVLARSKNLEYTPALVQTLDPKHEGILQAQLADSSSYLMFDAELGWTIRPNGRKSYYQANSQGLRATREYSLAPPPDKVRIAAFGDSFTHASGVPTGFTWEERLEELNPGLEVMNFGIPGSEPGQGLLRYRREGAKYRPHIVLIGFMSENINRVVNTFRPFYFARSGLPFAKPRFALRGDELVLIENPVRSLEQYREVVARPDEWLPRLGEHDYFYQRNSERSRFDALPSVRFAHVIGDQYLHQPILEGGVYNTESEAFRVTAAILDRFYREARANGSLPIVVLFPQRRDLRLRREGKPVTYKPLLDHLNQGGYRTIDLLDGFARYDPRTELLKRRFLHYPKAGNVFVAQHIRDVLAKEGLDRPEGVKRALAAANAGSL